MSKDKRIGEVTCPFCGSDDTRPSSCFERGDPGKVLQEMTCDTCDRTWCNQYAFERVNP